MFIQEYYDPVKSMLELVFAPCSPIAGTIFGRSPRYEIDLKMALKPTFMRNCA